MSRWHRDNPELIGTLDDPMINVAGYRQALGHITAQPQPEDDDPMTTAQAPRTKEWLSQDGVAILPGDTVYASAIRGSGVVVQRHTHQSRKTGERTPMVLVRPDTPWPGNVSVPAHSCRVIRVQP